MAYVKPSKTEIKFAYELLRYLHANVNNTYLLLAIIAWVRRESGQTYIGNNPLNIRPGADIKYRVGIRHSKHGYFSIYKNLTDAAKASAHLLMSQPHWAGYYLIVNAAQRDSGETPKQQQEQAMDFLDAIALSKWSATHYGTTGVASTYERSSNKLIAIWAGLTGHPITLPETPVKAKAKVPEPKQPRGFVNDFVTRDYIQPYAAFSFYESRVKAPDDNPGDPKSTGL